MIKREERERERYQEKVRKKNQNIVNTKKRGKMKIDRQRDRDIKDCHREE